MGGMPLAFFCPDGLLLLASSPVGPGNTWVLLQHRQARVLTKMPSDRICGFTLDAFLWVHLQRKDECCGVTSPSVFAALPPRCCVSIIEQIPSIHYSGRGDLRYGPRGACPHI